MFTCKNQLEKEVIQGSFSGIILYLVEKVINRWGAMSLGLRFLIPL